MQSADGVRLQRVRDFTVQIRNAATGEIVGTGVIVSADGGVATCAHVVEASLGVRPREAGDREVGVYFPLLAHQDRQQSAKVVGVFHQFDDDVVLLKIAGVLPLASTQVAVLGTAEPSQGHRFQSYGYRRLDDRLAGWAEGTIEGPVEVPEAGTFQSEPVQLSSSQINRGMSGAAVLDKERNLVVGLVSDTWFPNESTKDRDTAWAVDAKILSLAPFNISLRDEPLPLLPALQPSVDAGVTPRLKGQRLGVAWNTAPPHLSEWIGRQELLAELTKDWTEARAHITGLIGFGGEGKSSLARRWIEEILETSETGGADGVFWWGFFDKPDVDGFFNAALEYMTGRQVDPTKIGSTIAKAQYVGAMLGRGRYIFVLDGTDVLQHHEGDRYGQFQSQPLVEFLGYLAAPDTKSFALVTSRMQLHDLASYMTYRERDVTRLSTGDGIALLKAVGVQGPEHFLASLVDDWDGHALTLSVLGAYLVDAHHGDVSKAATIPPPTTGEQRYDRIPHVLRRYDEHLSAAEQALLMVISQPRLPISPAVAFDPVVSGRPLPDVLSPLAGTNRESLRKLIDRLTTYRILRYDEHQTLLSAHSLIRSHYSGRLHAQGTTAVAGIHRMLARAYLEHAGINLDDWERRVGNWNDIGSLEELRPAIEAIYHFCTVGDYDIAAKIDDLWINRDESDWLSTRLGAPEAGFDVSLNFFPDRNLARDPVQIRYLNAAGTELANLGRLDDALSLFRRALAASTRDQRWVTASSAARFLGACYRDLGNLAAAGQAWDQALQLHEMADLQRQETADDYENWRYWAQDLAYRENQMIWVQDFAFAAWIAAARGDDETATTRFQEMMIRLLTTPGVVEQWSKMPVGKAGMNYAEYLYHRGDLARSADVVAVCQQFAEKMGRITDQADCHRFWGVYFARLALRSERADEELRVSDRAPDFKLHQRGPDGLRDVSLQDFAGELSARAGEEFNRAVTIATRSTVDRQLAALAARGAWAARTGDLDLARQDLQAAVDRSSAGGFRLRHVEALTGQAWLAFAEGRLDVARNSARSALDLSRAGEYVWGQRDAEEVLEVLRRD